MTIKLHGHPLTSCTRRVLLALHEKQVAYELVLIDVPNKANKTRKYLEKQPFGVVPYLDDNGFIVYESRAICHYIATKFADQGTPGLVPSDPKSNAHFHQAVSVEQSYFSPYAEKIVKENLFKLLHGETPSIEVFESNVKMLDANLDGYERILSRQKYLAGDNITLADLYHLPHASLLAAANAPLLDVETRPNVARWWKDISGRPSWTNCDPYPNDMLSKVSGQLLPMELHL